LAEIEVSGAAGLSVRSVARRLGVDAKSLYNHVDGKSGLLDAVAEHVLATMVLPAPVGDLDADLRAFAHAFREHALQHPHAAALVLTRQTPTAASLAPVEAALALLADAGFAPPDAVHVLRLILASLIGMVLREVDAAPTFGAGDPGATRQRRTLLEQAALPHVVAAAEDLATFDRDLEFTRGIDLLTAAITQLTARGGSGQQ
jgi:AcrR family transcriptional regulator